MKKKRLIKSIFISLIVIIALIGSTVIFAKNNKVKVNQQTGAEIDIDVAKNKEYLKIERLKTKEKKEEVVLNVKWGENINNFKMSIYQESEDTPISYSTPSSYAIDNEGNIYVCDTKNYQIKVFNNNDLIRIINLPKDMVFVLRDIDVDSEGIIYGTDYQFNNIIKIDKNDNVEVFLKDTEFNRLATIDVLCSGNIMIEDNDASTNALRVRKFDMAGNLISEKLTSNFIDYDLYDYESQNGNIISLAPIGLGVHQITLKDKDKSDIAISNFSHEPASDDTMCSSDLLGVDNSGNVYFHITDALKSTKEFEKGMEWYWKQSKEYICRIDIVNNKSESIKIENTDKSMSSSTANLCSNFIKIDNFGNIYQLVINEQGYKIIRYSFK